MLTAQIMRRFRIVTHWVDAGYFETESLRQLRDDVLAAIRAGRLVAICGPVGSPRRRKRPSNPLREGEANCDSTRPLPPRSFAASFARCPPRGHA